MCIRDRYVILLTFRFCIIIFFLSHHVPTIVWMATASGLLLVSTRLFILVLLLQLFQLPLIDRRDRHIGKVIIPIQKLVGIGIDRPSNTYEKRKAYQVFLKKRLSCPDHSGSHLPCSGVLVRTRFKHRVSESFVYLPGFLPHDQSSH